MTELEAEGKDTAIAELAARLAPWSRPYWKPETVDEDGPVTASKFSGRPWLSPDEVWPICPSCEQPLQLFVQLNTQDFPAEVKDNYGNGLIQLFYCTSSEPLCEDDCEAYAPFSESVLARRVEPQAASVGDGVVPSMPEGHFPPKRITGWTAAGTDLPSAEETRILLNAAGQTLSESEDDLLWEVTEQTEGDKLGGWPMWVQGVEYPDCPDCGCTMELVMQIDSEDHLPYMFGDLGCGHLTQCPKHPEQLAFAWACG